MNQVTDADYAAAMKAYEAASGWALLGNAEETRAGIAAILALRTRPAVDEGMVEPTQWPGDELHQLIGVLETIEYVAHNDIKANGMKTIWDFARYAQALAPRIRAALASPVQPGGETGATHRHVKRGSEYRLLATGTYTSLDPAQDDADVYVAQVAPGVWHVQWAFGDVEGKAWARMQCATPVEHGAVVSIYQSMDDAMIWVRPREEFEDGRYDRIAPTAVLEDVPKAE